MSSSQVRSPLEPLIPPAPSPIIPLLAHNHSTKLTPTQEDDLCGLSLSIRFNSNLITIWNRDGTAQATVDGMLNTILTKISPDIRPKDGSYYYKRHSEHAGFSDVLAKAAENALISGKIEEAKVREGEVERQEEEERAKEEEEARRRSRAFTVA